jgi:lipopolysaccharide transport system permease protein
MSFAVQFGVFLIGLGYYLWKAQFHPDPVHPYALEPNWRMILLPAFLLQISMLGMGVGCIVASLSTRYRDLTLSIGFFVQIWMYASAVVFPLSRISIEDRWFFYLNPIVPIVEAIRFAFLGSGLVEKVHVLTSFGVCSLICLLGLVMFNRAEQTVMDTV